MAVVYILGAGASRHVGYPLASEMGDGLLDYMLSDDNGRDAAEFLIGRFGKKRDFEELVTESQLLTASLKDSADSRDRAQRSRLGYSNGQMTQFLQQWFRRIRAGSAPLYADFAFRFVQPSDTIITFNYDDSLERELRSAGKWDVGRGYAFPINNDGTIPGVTVLKLHGSINWLINFFGGATGGTFLVDPGPPMGDCLVIHQIDLKFLGYENFTGRTYKSGGAIPCLIMPGRNKQFFYDTSFGHEFFGFWEHLWHQAKVALAHCERIVICGYSLLPVDERACNLLMKTPGKETPVEVISGGQNERIVCQFRNAGFTEVSAPARYFEDWLNKRSPKSG